MKSVILALVGTVFAYGDNMCRQFKDDDIVQDFHPDQFYGFWFPKYTTASNPYLYG
jgi:hypothetical protein